MFQSNSVPSKFFIGSQSDFVPQRRKIFGKRTERILLRVARPENSEWPRFAGPESALRRKIYGKRRTETKDVAPILNRVFENERGLRQLHILILSCIRLKHPTAFPNRISSPTSKFVRRDDLWQLKRQFDGVFDLR